VANGSGTVAAANVTNVTVTCTTPTFTIGGTVSGLRAGSTVVLQNNTLGNNLSVTANGSFTFATPVASGGAYAVTVLTQPTSAPARSCDVKTLTGTGTVGAANVTTVVVNCHAKFAFVANRSGDPGLASYSIGSTGLLTLVDFETQSSEPLSGTAPVCTSADANGVAVTPTGSHALVTIDAQLSATDPCFVNTSGEIKVFEISAAGQLAETPTQVVLPNVLPTPNVRSDPSAILMHPSGNFVYVQDANSNTVNNILVSGGNEVIRSYAFTPGTPGVTPPTLAPTAGTGYVAVTDLNSMAMDPTGGYMMAASYTSHAITRLSINGTTGVLSAAGAPVVVGVLPSQLNMALDPTGTYLFVAQDRDATIYSYDVSLGTFAPRTVALSTTQAGQLTSPVVALIVDPSGRPYLYGARSDGSIVVYLITGLTGAITEVANYNRAVAPYGILYGLSIDPNGQFLYHSALSTTGNIGIFSIGTNGALTEVVPGSPFAPVNAVNADASGTRNIAIP
jgi:6-phosphogluconolactonase (cycloisomerase 2 family)